MTIINKNYLKILTIVISTIFFIYNTYSIGISYDQIFHIENGERRLKYLFSLGQSEYYDILHLRYYPGLYDTIVAFLATVFPRSFYYESYNLINFLTALAGVFGLKKVVKIFFGTQISNIFFIITILSPVYFGHFAINPKDTIIATANFWILYYVIKYLKKNSDHIRRDSSIKIGLFIGLGAGVRVLFLGTLIPLILFLFLEIFFFKKIVNNLKLKQFFNHILLIILISYVLIVLCWPNTHSNILIQPFTIFFQSLVDASQGVQASYFAGEHYKTINTPWYYLFLNFFYRVPLIYLFTFFLTFIFIKEIMKLFKLNSNFFYFFNISIFFLLFPFLIAIFLKLKIHDGLRYFLYLIPLFNILPSIFLYYLSKELNLFYKKAIIISLIPLFGIFLFKFIAISPYQYSYLNLANDIFLKKNSFENDYWGTSLKELISNFSKKNDDKNFLKIATCGVNPINVKYYLKKNNIKNFSIVDLDDKFDYAILVNRAISDNSTDDNQTCYTKFLNKNTYIVVKKSFIDLSKIVEY